MEKKDQDQLVRDAQYRKSRSIAFFSSTNAAIELLKSKIDKYKHVLDENNLPIQSRSEQTQEFIIFWRDWFLAEYDKDYKANVMTIGLPPEVIAGLDKAKESFK